MTQTTDRTAILLGRIAQTLPTALFLFALISGNLEGTALAALGLTSAVLLFGYPLLTPMSPPEVEDAPETTRVSERGFRLVRPCGC